MSDYLIKAHKTDRGKGEKKKRKEKEVKPGDFGSTVESDE